MTDNFAHMKKLEKEIATKKMYALERQDEIIFSFYTSFQENIHGLHN